MDLETENRIAAILLKEAAELRRQAENEGVYAYLHQTKARGKPNSRFLTATVLGVQQANRAVEENELWRARQKEIELDSRLKRRPGDVSKGTRIGSNTNSGVRQGKRHIDVESVASSSSSSRKREKEEHDVGKEEGLRDDEVEEFLHSRSKRGRGAVGSRMDETGPYLPSGSDLDHEYLGGPYQGLAKEHRVLGPEKLPSIESDKSLVDHKYSRKKEVKSSKHHSRKHKSKSTSRDKKRKKSSEKGRSKHDK